MTSSEKIDRAIDDILMEGLRDHRAAHRLPGKIVCECGDSFERRHGKSATYRHQRHISWALAWALREEGYAHVPTDS